MKGLFRRLIDFDVDLARPNLYFQDQRALSSGTARELLSGPVDLPQTRPTFGGPTRRSVPRCVFYVHPSRI